MPQSVSFAEILKAQADAERTETHTSLPGQVIAYDPVTQTADIQPMVKEGLYNRDGERAFESLPTLAGVPVAFPRGGGYVMSFPLEPGDFVWLVFAESSIAEWRLTGQESEPQDARRMSLGYPVAFPCVYPDTKPLSPTDALERVAGLVLGKDGGNGLITINSSGVQLGKGAQLAGQPVALAPLILTALTALQATVAAIQAEILASSANPVDPTKAAAIAAISASGVAVTAAVATSAATLVKAI